MGKLGGYELNLSSDIDLIFVHSADGMTDGAKSTSNEDFFSRLIKKVAPALDSLTGYGRVFQVDLRLRPWGSAGPPAFLVNDSKLTTNNMAGPGSGWRCCEPVR